MTETLSDLERRLGRLTSEDRAKLNDLLAPELSSPWLPNPGPQTEAYLSPADLLLYGGAAGGGKSDLLLGLAMTRHRRSVIFRRTLVDLAGVEQRLLQIAGDRTGWRSDKMIWSRPPRLVEFGALEKPGAELSWQGRPHDFIGFDEGAQLTAAKAAFVLGWLRSSEVGQRCRAVIASNPPMGGEGQWLIAWFAPWLDPQHPHPAEPGELRWAVMRGEETVWVDGPAPVTLGGETYTPMSRAFVAARLEDNPYLAVSGYRARLQNLPEPLRSQLLKGDFLAGREDHAWQVIPSEWVRLAQDRWRGAGEGRRAMVALACDPALGGADCTAIARLHADAWFAPMVVVPGAECREPAEVAALMLRHQKDGADLSVDGTGGWGSGVRSHLERDHGLACADLRAEDGLSSDEKILAEAKRRFRRCETWEATARHRFLQDVKFVNGDAHNHYQWPDEVRAQRDGQERPCLTVNKTRQHCLQIINDARQNKTSIKIKPVGDEASYDAARIYEGIVRRIEYLSNTDAIYTLATCHQVQGGIGYWRVVTDYAGPDSFDQEIFLKPVTDPMTIFLDPDIQEADGSDARYGIVFRRVPRDEFREAYPQYADRGSGATLGNADAWTDSDQVMVAEYFRKSERKDRLVAYADPLTGESKTVRLSQIQPLGREAVKAVLEDPTAKVRDIAETTVEWFKIVGEEIVERRDWPGRYIPIVRAPGEETVIDGELDRKGHVRALIDPQRMYNYNASAEVEFGALQGKSPYLAPAQAIEGHETYWQTANTVNHSVLPWNHKDDDGSPIPPPERAQPPGTAPAFIAGMQAAAQDMQLVSGQYQAQMGQPSNERSGVAIQQRQRQGDNATYHYIDHLAMAIRFTGKIIVDLAPKIYDTPRVMKILQEDGAELHIQIDPSAPQAHAQVEAAQAGKIAAVFNPRLGDYEVQADVGPAFATRRQEAFNALSQIAAQNPDLMSVIGDLVLRAADFPLAEEAAERLKKLAPPQALGQGPSPAETQLQQQLATVQQLVKKMADELAAEKTRALSKAALRDVERFDAETRRLQALKDALPVDPAGLAELIHTTVGEALQVHMTQILGGAAESGT